MYEFNCQLYHPDDTLVVLPTMGFIYFKKKPQTGYNFLSKLNVDRLFFQGPDHTPPNTFSIVSSTLGQDEMGSRWLLYMKWNTSAAIGCTLSQRLWHPFLDTICLLQRRRRRIVAKRLLPLLSAFVALVRLPPPSSSSSSSSAVVVTSLTAVFTALDTIRPRMRRYSTTLVTISSDYTVSDQFDLPADFEVERARKASDWTLEECMTFLRAQIDQLRPQRRLHVEPF